MVRGRKPTDVDTLKLHGTFKKGRHGDRELAPGASGEPVRPEHLTEEAAQFWDFVVSELVSNGTVKRLDTMELTAAAEMWQLYRKTVESAKQNPLDKDIRIAVTSYLTEWRSMASDLGLTPAARQRLRSDNKVKKSSVATRTRGA
jgi:P27 family predicted phage terminase small subunit